MLCGERQAFAPAALVLVRYGIFARNCEALNSYEERIIQTEKVCADLSSLRKVLGSAHLFFFRDRKFRGMIHIRAYKFSSLVIRW